MATRKESYPQLLSLAVHELRTPANVVSGYLRMLQLLPDNDPPLGERQRRMVDEAARACAHLLAILAELSEVSKLDAGAIDLPQQSFDLFPLVQQVAGSVHDGEDRQVFLEVRGKAAGAPILGDATRLRGALAAVFRAVIREKLDACTVVAERRLESRKARVSAVIVVAESGRVRGAYSAKPGPFDDKRSGLGLALPIARRVIELHGGRLWSPQGADGRGAALVALPVARSNR